MSYQHDKELLRPLAEAYLTLCGQPAQQQRRRDWRALNSLRMTRPLLYVRAFAWEEMAEAALFCRTPAGQRIERSLRYQLYWGALDDDSIFEPYLVLPACHRHSGWGYAIQRNRSGHPRGSFKVDYPLKDLDDLSGLQTPVHSIAEEETARQLAIWQELLDGILPVYLDRASVYRFWGGDISTDLGYLRGIENIMLDLSDNPAGLHRLCAWMSAGILKAQAEAEAAGDWSFLDHQNQAMPYAEELTAPGPGRAQRADLWCFMAAQEWTLISPQHFEEFMLQYQLPILKQFALTAYGCCEDLTQKISVLRQIPNLRRIAVSPFADVGACAAQIGRDYVISYRPNPAILLGPNYRDNIRQTMRRDCAILRGTCFDVTLKDVETVEADPRRVRDWVAITRECIEETGG
ncbi:MAG: hypothetical protein GX564_06110 [Oligosphaeraceae bacterium]|nr:hypothetical protein [Oligosphaeraceae bacterium]